MRNLTLSQKRFISLGLFALGTIVSFCASVLLLPGDQELLDWIFPSTAPELIVISGFFLMSLSIAWYFKIAKAIHIQSQMDNSQPNKSEKVTNLEEKSEKPLTEERLHPSLHDEEHQTETVVNESLERASPNRSVFVGAIDSDIDTAGLFSFVQTRFEEHKLTENDSLAELARSAREYGEDEIADFFEKLSLSDKNQKIIDVLPDAKNWG